MMKMPHDDRFKQQSSTVCGRSTGSSKKPWRVARGSRLATARGCWPRRDNGIEREASVLRHEASTAGEEEWNPTTTTFLVVCCCCRSGRTIISMALSLYNQQAPPHSVFAFRVGGWIENRNHRLLSPAVTPTTSRCFVFVFDDMETPDGRSAHGNVVGHLTNHGHDIWVPVDGWAVRSWRWRKLWSIRSIEEKRTIDPSSWFVLESRERRRARWDS
jgi:hypothetical protein